MSPNPSSLLYTLSDMTLSTIKRVSKVQAVNRLLSTIGVAPLADTGVDATDLGGTLSLTSDLAQTALDNVSRDLQSTPGDLTPSVKLSLLPVRMEKSV